MNVLIWFKRDLRLEDQPALALAAAKGPVLPVHVVDPEDWAQPDRAARHWAFAAESLTDLRAALAAHGVPLVLRTGETVAVLDRLVRAHAITEIVSQAAPGTGWAQARDRRVAAWARSTGLRWTELPPDATPPADLPPLTATGPVEPGTLPSARALHLADDPCPNRPPGGRPAALALLDSYLSTRAASPRDSRHPPLTAERASARLSAHLAFGTLGTAEIATACAARLAERPGPAIAAGLRHLRTGLSLRAAAHAAALSPPAPRLIGDARLRHALEQGETGLPFLDACLRYLRATGWLNHRCRALVASAALHHLGLDPAETGTFLARRCLDYDPAIHWPQIAALAAPPRSAAHPVRAGQMLDPTGAFTRRWVPELAPLPDALLQEPWKWPGARTLLGRRYPETLASLTPTPRPALPQPRRPASAAQLSLDL
ncbi:deoxyribodipyrimidine photo-lyase [Gemmobacter aquatilis]|uniref:Deoxyribodipyrimidine photo-lyase n=1 Tax=Gemmobacter aquatilis TaxID=933059 RepID=A0A1H8CGG6_9RHOB|nr:FAD-binding domain-containing protein [Gemmobacter aquatilis]SEM93989.1 deoxyribodipyrimidine photo-lyase [Gemmobacter aquatilis]